MKPKHIPLLLATIGPSVTAAPTDSAPNYYEFEGPVVRAPRPPISPIPERRKSFVVDGDGGHQASLGNRNSGKAGMEENAVQAAQDNQPPLPPNMDRGVRDLEAGMEDLQAYTAVMAAHVQRNGMRGFLTVPPEIKDQGVAVGRKIGGGISGIMTDVAHEMIVPEKH